jgi:hypothetical protein
MLTPQEQPIVGSPKQGQASLFDKLYSGWAHVYGPDKTAAELKEMFPDVTLPDLAHLDSDFIQVYRRRALPRYCLSKC